MHTTTYVVTVYSDTEPTKQRKQIHRMLTKHIDGFGGTGKIEGFDIFVDRARPWLGLTGPLPRSRFRAVAWVQYRFRKMTRRLISVVGEEY